MHIYVDADAFPKVIKEVLFRAAERLQIPLNWLQWVIWSSPPIFNQRDCQAFAKQRYKFLVVCA
jgi:hypothetical protein